DESSHCTSSIASSTGLFTARPSTTDKNAAATTRYEDLGLRPVTKPDPAPHAALREVLSLPPRPHPKRSGQRQLTRDLTGHLAEMVTNTSNEAMMHLSRRIYRLWSFAAECWKMPGSPSKPRASSRESTRPKQASLP